MLERCPFYEKCSSSIRHIRGNSEYYCLGSINWEFCPEFKDLLLSGATFQGFGRDDEIKKIARTIYKKLHDELQSSLIIALVTCQGEILYRDRQWTETYLLVIQNIVRYLIDSIRVGEFIELKNLDNFLFIKIKDTIMLICMTQIELDQLIELIKENISDYQTFLTNYLRDHPISVEMEPAETPEKRLVLNLFTDLQQKLEAINPKIIIKDLNKIKDKISEFFSWNRIFYEISILIEKLEQSPFHDELKHKDKEKILEKIKEWQEKIRQTT